MSDNEFEAFCEQLEVPLGLKILVENLNLSEEAAKMVLQLWSTKMISHKDLKTLNIVIDKETVEAIKSFKPESAEKRKEEIAQAKKDPARDELEKTQAEFPRGSQKVPYFTAIDKIKPTVQSLLTKCVCQAVGGSDAKETSTKKEETTNLKSRVYQTLDAKPESMIKNLSMEGLDPQSLSVLSQAEINQVIKIFLK